MASVPHGFFVSRGNINEGALTNTKMSHARLTKAQGGAIMRLTNIS